MTQFVQNDFTDFLLYKTSNWEVKIDVFLKDENIWLSQKKFENYFELIDLWWQNILKIFLKLKSWKKIQYVQNLYILQKIEKFRIIEDRNYISDFDSELEKFLSA